MSRSIDIQIHAASEKELIKRARSGDAAAFECILDRYQERVMRVILSILKNPMDAEEVTQDVFMAAFTKIDQFREEASFSTWLHRIAVNAALMRKRREKTAVHLPLEEMLPDFDEKGGFAADVADWSKQVDDPMLEAEIRTVIQEAIERLDSKYQTVFLLRDVEGFSTGETASILGLGIPAVKTRLHRARLFLRGELAEYFEKQDSGIDTCEWSPSAQSEPSLAYAV